MYTEISWHAYPLGEPVSVHTTGVDIMVSIVLTETWELGGVMVSWSYSGLYPTRMEYAHAHGAALWIRKATYYIRSTVLSELFRNAAFFGVTLPVNGTQPSLSSNFASRQRFRNSLTTFCLDMLEKGSVALTPGRLSTV